jgi:lipid A disaccharide synthetase
MPEFPMEPKTFMLIAGEASGDLLAAESFATALKIQAVGCCRAPFRR